MKYLFKFVFGASLGLLVFGSFACTGDSIPGLCSNNADCDVHFYCGPDSRCLCETDAACGDGMYCNASGSCQTHQGCLADTDCDDPINERCEIVTAGKGVCKCLNDAACGDGFYCNPTGSCQTKVGCFRDEDCGEASYFFCRINAESKIGECFCKHNDACAAGEFCNPNGYCQTLATCVTHDDCPAGKLCDTESGDCLCDSLNQSGCKDDEICNASGYCQPRPGCYDNSDCLVAGTFCDVTSRTCIPEGTCNSDRQCPLAQICRQNACIDGCNTMADCPLTHCCQDFQCAPCDCQDDGFCGLIESCLSGQCQSAYSAETPYCKPCARGVVDDCGSNQQNRCLIYPFDDDEFAAVSEEYCSVDCSDGTQCPNGFTCGAIRVVDPAEACIDDSDCPTGVPCLKSQEADKAYCACHATKNPCPPDACGLITKTCINSKKPCQTTADCLIPCETYEGVDYGGCVMGRNCGLDEGIHCSLP